MLAASSPCAAQDAAAAEALFKKGLAELEAGRLDSACPAFAESLRLDPRPGSLFTLAECEAKAGLVASAAVHYGDYLGRFSRMTAAEQSKQRGRDEISKTALAKLQPRVPKLTIRIPADAPADATVLRNGSALGRAALGVPLPVDPGEQTLVLRMRDGRETRRTVNVKESTTEEVQLELPDAPSASTPVATPGPSPTADSPTLKKSGGHTLAYVVGGVGLAGLAVGGITGAMVLGKKSTIEDHCVDTQCDATGKDAADSAQTLGLVSTIGFGVGVVGLGLSTVLLLSGGTAETPQRARRTLPVLVASEHGAWLGLRGSL
ncbi:MAG: hypothetical protein IPI67_30375 [Myxococcales bacterium]|nr:hypothetical protein [Myxococcales bacterium]